MTSTVPAECAGVTAVQVMVEVQFTDVASGAPPKWKAVVFVPTPNPVPVISTVVPPAVDPLLGVMLVIVGSSKTK